MWVGGLWLNKVSMLDFLILKKGGNHYLPIWTNLWYNFTYLKIDGRQGKKQESNSLSSVSVAGQQNHKRRKNRGLGYVKRNGKKCTWGSKPMSSMRSASSKTRYVTRLNSRTPNCRLGGWEVYAFIHMFGMEVKERTQAGALASSWCGLIPAYQSVDQV